MQIRVLAAVALAAISSFAFNPQAHAFSVTISVDENGLGIFSNSDGFTTHLGAFAGQPDPGPGGLAAALTYDLLNPPGLVAGDVRLIEPSCGGCIGDIIRFNPNEVITGTGALVFYSAIGGGTLADKGFPTALYTNVLDISEINDIATYTPTAGQPGFVAGAAGPVTYVITSNDATPLPAALPLFASGAGVLGFFGWRRKRKPAA